MMFVPHAPPTPNSAPTPAPAPAKPPAACSSREVCHLLKVLAAHDAKPKDLVQVEDLLNKAQAAGVPWLQILFAVLPFILTIFTGGTINIQALIAAILALLNPPAPS